MVGLEKCLPLARHGKHAPLQSLTLTFIARILLWAKGPEHPRVAQALDESFALAAAASRDMRPAICCSTLGDLAWRRGDAQRAFGIWRQALEVRSQLADRRGIANCLERMSWALAAIGKVDQAGFLLGAVDAQRVALRMPLQRDEQPYHAAALAAAPAVKRTQGQETRMEEAVQRALALGLVEDALLVEP